jgi:hypothetical protein
MNRKEFLKSSAKMGACCGAMTLLQQIFLSDAEPIHAAESPPANLERRRKFAIGWIQWLMASVDEVLDAETAARLMEANGQACHTNAYAPTPKGNKTHLSLEEWVARTQGYVGKENCRKEGNRIFFNYFRNGKGLKVEDGFCLCPLIEDAPKQISPTYCRCSVGYVREMMRHSLGIDTQVELLESIRSGGKGCKFVITV